MMGQRFSLLNGVGDSTTLIAALTDALSGKSTVKTASNVTADFTPTASGTVIAVASLAVVAVYLATHGRRRPRRRRSKRRAT